MGIGILELGVVPHAEPGHHLHARQVGIPLVRSLILPPHAPAFIVTLTSPSSDGSDAPHRLPASQRPDACLRVEL